VLKLFVVALLGTLGWDHEIPNVIKMLLKNKVCDLLIFYAVQKHKKSAYLILEYTYPTNATLHSLFYLETALHVSGGIITHHQERKQLHLQHLLFVTPLLLSAAIVEELEPV
jgi:hypothetical protein